MNFRKGSLWIGELIRERIDCAVPVYPCVVPSGSPERFCVYRRTGYQGRDTKDRFNYEETLSVQISVVAPSYDESLRLADTVMERLDGIKGLYKGKMLQSCTCVNSSETYNEGAFIQNLFFSFTFDLTDKR